MLSYVVRRAVSGLVLAGLFALSACGGSGSGGETATPTPTPPVVTVPVPVPVPAGVVAGLALTSDNSAPIASATVTVGALSTKTAADGSFSIDKVPAADRVVIKIEAAGYLDGFAAVSLAADQTARASARLVRAAAAVSIDPTVASTVSTAGSNARVALSANSLVNAATGAAISGAVTASVTPIDPASDPQSMPGDYTTSNTATAERIESFGAIKVVLKDASGARLNLKTGSTATIRIPLASRSANPPASIPLFYLNETTGRWVQEGSASLTGTAPNQYYEGSVTHFSWWNADVVQDTVFVNGCVNNAAGLPAKFAAVYSDGIDYSGGAISFSKADGSFQLAIRKASRAQIFAEVSVSQVSAALQVGPSTIDINLPTCLTLSNAALVPSILLQPRSSVVTAGDTAYFIVSASGARPVKYQWQKNGADIFGATSSTLFTNLLSVADSGARYSVVVTNAAGSVTSAEAVLTVQPVVVLSAPAFSVQPLAQTVVSGSVVAFTALANGSPEPTYQWKRGNVNIAGATSARYITPALALADNGALYSVVATNSQGAVASAVAAVTVTAPQVGQTAPVFTQQPASVSVSVGGSATFTSLATGLPAPTYQWRKAGVNIVGATAASYTTPAATLADNAANYSVVATNTLGSVTSTPVLLTVTASPGPVTPQTAPGGLYVGYYQEDPATNPEDAVPGAFSLNLPATNGAFSGSMFFTYVGCQSTNVGLVGGTKTDLALSGTWSGTLDGLPQSGAYTGAYSAATGSYAGTYTNAGGKQYRDLAPCIQYWIAPNGTWEMFPVDTQVPSGSLNIGISGRTLNWSVVSGASYALVYLLDESVATSTGNPVVWQTLLPAGNAVVIPASVSLQSGRTYIVSVGISNSIGKRLAFASKRFVQP